MTVATQDRPNAPTLLDMALIVAYLWRNARHSLALMKTRRTSSVVWTEKGGSKKAQPGRHRGTGRVSRRTVIKVAGIGLMRRSSWSAMHRDTMHNVDYIVKSLVTERNKRAALLILSA